MFSEAVGFKQWVLSPARNCPRLISGDRKWADSEFQTTGAATVKLRRLSFRFVVLVLGTNKSPRSAERRELRAAISNTDTQVGRASTTDTVERENSDLKLNLLRYWQPMENVAKIRRTVIVQIQYDWLLTPGLTSRRLLSGLIMIIGLFIFLSLLLLVSDPVL